MTRENFRSRKKFSNTYAEEEEEEEEEETLYSKLSEIVIKTQDSNEVYIFFKKKD